MPSCRLAERLKPDFACTAVIPIKSTSKTTAADASRRFKGHPHIADNDWIELLGSIPAQGRSPQERETLQSARKE